MWGDTGVGKTFSARRHYGDTLYVLRLPQYGDLARWDGYRQGYHKAVLIDEFRGQIDVATLNAWIDVWPFDARTFGGAESIRPEIFIINSNRPPGAWWNGVRPGSIEYKAIERRWTQAGACVCVGSRENVLEFYNDIVRRHEADDRRIDLEAVERLEAVRREEQEFDRVIRELESTEVRVEIKEEETDDLPARDL